MSKTFYKSINYFMWYFCLIVIGGGIASFFVDEPMHVTFAMLIACLGFIPLLIGVAFNRKGVPENDT